MVRTVQRRQAENGHHVESHRLTLPLGGMQGGVGASGDGAGVLARPPNFSLCDSKWLSCHHCRQQTRPSMACSGGGVTVTLPWLCHMGSCVGALGAQWGSQRHENLSLMP